MLTSAIKEASGYFDRRALTSAFGPSLLFCALTAAGGALLGYGGDGDQTLTKLNELNTGGQVALAVGVIALAAVGSFVVVGVRRDLIAVLEGQTDLGLLPFRRLYPLGWWWRWRRDRLLALRGTLGKQLATCGEALDKVAEALKAEPPAAPALDAGTVTSTINALFAGPPALHKRVRKRALRAGQRAYGQSWSGTQTADELWVSYLLSERSEARFTELADKVKLAADEWRKVLSVDPATVPAAADFGDRKARLGMFLRAMRRALEGLNSDLRFEHTAVSDWLFCRYPPEADRVEPTRLGNVIRAAEAYPWTRYRADTQLLWPRLMAVVPKEFAEATADDYNQLQLYATMTWGTLLFAVVWAVGYAVFKPPGWSWWWLAAGGAACVAGAVVWYQCAVNAARAYGDRVRVAFDLYRWKVLESFNLQVPPDLTAEEKTWEALARWLYFREAPDKAAFRYAKNANAYPAAQTRAVVLARTALNAGHTLAPADLKPDTSADRDAPEDPFGSVAAAVGCTLTAAVDAGKAVSARGVTFPGIAAGTHALVPVPLPSETVAALDLRAGDAVTLVALVPDPANPAAPSAPRSVAGRVARIAPADAAGTHRVAVYVPVADVPPVSAAVLKGAFTVTR